LPSNFWGIYEVDFPEDAHTIGSRGIQSFPLEPFFSAFFELSSSDKDQLILQNYNGGNDYGFQI